MALPTTIEFVDQAITAATKANESTVVLMRLRASLDPLEDGSNLHTAYGFIADYYSQTQKPRFVIDLSPELKRAVILFADLHKNFARMSNVPTDYLPVTGPHLLSVAASLAKSVSRKAPSVELF